MAMILWMCLSLTIWLFLILFWGNFWLSNSLIEEKEIELESYPTVWAIVPARNEERAIANSVTSLLQQQYLGKFTLVVVDDNSGDRTGSIAVSTAKDLNKLTSFDLVSGKPLAPGWKGKLWAMKQGIDRANEHTPAPDYFLFTDADIYHDSKNLSQLVTKAETEDLDLVSLMVLLRCQSFWEKLLIPAFVFFFQKLYPFSWVNNPQKSIAAAAGGCILIKREALEAIGGIEAIKDALIDDCSLAKAVKDKQKKLWLGLTKNTISLREYNNLKSIWDTIARTAYNQLNYSLLLLIGTLAGMTLVYLVPPIGLIIGLILHQKLLILIATITWLLMAAAYIPTIKLYDLSIIWALNLPAVAFLYTLMTIDSALKYYQGKGGAWKGRTY